jgi:hypothetical protein
VTSQGAVPRNGLACGWQSPSGAVPVLSVPACLHDLTLDGRGEGGRRQSLREQTITIRVGITIRIGIRITIRIKITIEIRIATGIAICIKITMIIRIIGISIIRRTGLIRCSSLTLEHDEHLKMKPGAA